MQQTSHSRHGEQGNTLIMALIFVVFLVALSTAQSLVVTKNMNQSDFMNNRLDLHYYAETAAHLAVHDLRNLDRDGRIGTAGWAPVNDVGQDGQAGTGDQGEGDGMPDPGEPNTVPVSVGPAEDDVTVLVLTADSAYAGVTRVVARAFRDDGMSSTVEIFGAPPNANLGAVPRVGAVYVDPNVVLDLKGNSFVIDGNDTNPDGTPGPGAAVHGIGTALAATPGDNAQNLIDQIPTARQDQVTGLGGTPSVGETSETVDLQAMFDAYSSAAHRNLGAGTYDDVIWGDESNYEITYATGDVMITGEGTGSGVLVVDGNLNISGQFQYHGLVIVLGDVRVTGGGSGVHVYGATMVASTITVIDEEELTVTGNADLVYSSAALANVEAMAAQVAGNGFEISYWSAVR